jgi:leader peptidase (prepilin peptidase)/N-methyltransferase
MSWLVGLAGLPALGVPAGIRALPEPADEALPEPAEDDTAVQRMLRAEGAKPLYRDVAALPRLGLWATVLGVLVDVAIGLRLGNHLHTWVIGLLVPVLLLLAAVDWRTRLLPRVVVLPTTGVLLALLLLEWLVTSNSEVLVRAVIGMLAARSLFWMLWFVRRAGMGFGDVRLAALLGLVLARLGWMHWIVGLYAGLVLFAVFGIGLAVVRRDRSTLKKAYPFGPFMIGGALVGVLLGGSVHVGG